MLLPWHQYLMAVLYILAGVNHFRNPKMYEKIMPPYIPAHKNMVVLSGVAQMILGFMLLIPENQSIAAWGIIVMLLVFLSVHVHMLTHEDASIRLPKWVLILRIPLQFLLIYWAYLYT